MIALLHWANIARYRISQLAYRDMLIAVHNGAGQVPDLVAFQVGVQSCDETGEYRVARNIKIKRSIVSRLRKILHLIIVSPPCLFSFSEKGYFHEIYIQLLKQRPSEAI